MASPIDTKAPEPDEEQPRTPATGASSSPQEVPSSPRVSHPAAFSSLFPQFHHRMPASTHISAPSLDQYIAQNDADLEYTARNGGMMIPGWRMPEMSPELSIELRLRWLEALVLGAGKGTEDGKRVEKRQHQTLARRAEEMQSRLAALTEENTVLKRIVACHDLYAPLLAPKDETPEAPGALLPDEADAYFDEAEVDVRAADRDMTDIVELERKGVLNAGRISEHEALKPRLCTLSIQHAKNRKKFSTLEARIATLLQTYSSQVDALSERFVAWNDIITDTEVEVTRLEKERAEKVQRGQIYVS